MARAGRAIAAALGLVLLPKCPLCIAAYLVSFGVGTGAAALAAPLIRPLAMLLAGTALLALLASAWRAKAKRAQPAERRSRAACCCG
ncbi:MAG: hypothetical protein ABUL60_10735 [Myxococcales bacterium]